MLARAGGPLKTPHRWYGSSSCIVVLTKDDWLHCFRCCEANRRAGNSKSVSKPTATSTGPSARRTNDSGNGPEVALDAPPNVSGESGDSDYSEDCRSNSGIAAFDLFEAEPQWSMFIPSTTVAAPSGRGKCFEIEEVKRQRFLGLRSTRREALEASSEEEVQRWLSTLRQVQNNTA